jgi:hypothetical protein
MIWQDKEDGSAIQKGMQEQPTANRQASGTG